MRGSIGGIVLIVLVAALLVGALLLLLFGTGVFSSSDNDEPILNTEFLPVGRGGTLVVKEFVFCSFVDERFNCFEKRDTFSLGDEVHFRFVIESSSYEGQLLLVENYRVKKPDGAILLDVEEKNNFHVSRESSSEVETTVFKDYFVLGTSEPEGDYTLELLLENPLLGKKVLLTKHFTVEKPYYLTDDYREALEND